jgi:hypothetical protein
VSGERDLGQDEWDELGIRFVYHPPTAEQAERMQRIRDECLQLAGIVMTSTPRCREQSLALTAIEEVSMWANAAIARREGGAS